jgi:TusA-related sulfurtransferase
MNATLSASAPAAHFHVTALDTRGLPAPEPALQILEALDLLGPDEQLRVLTEREPTQLYPVLERTGYSHRCTALRKGRCELLIWLALAA